MRAAARIFWRRHTQRLFGRSGIAFPSCTGGVGEHIPTPAATVLKLLDALDDQTVYATLDVDEETLASLT